MTGAVDFKNDKMLEVLLVEDNLPDIVLTKKAFKDAMINANITIAENSSKAIDLLRRKEDDKNNYIPDLILLDLNLPGEGGNELLEKIKGNTRLNRIPVVVLTGSNADADVFKSYELKAHSYIIKPVSKNSLLSLDCKIW